MIGKLLCALGRHEVLSYRYAYSSRVVRVCLRCEERWEEDF